MIADYKTWADCSFWGVKKSRSEIDKISYLEDKNIFWIEWVKWFQSQRRMTKKPKLESIYSEIRQKFAQTGADLQKLMNR